MTEIRKPYKPKPEKVAKLTAYMDKLPKIKCELFKRTATVILIAAVLTSCSAQWHIKRAIKKDPSVLQPTTHVIDTIVIRQERVISDTFLSKEYDTMVVQDSFVYTQVIREKDFIRVYTKCKGDTIRITKTVSVPQVVKSDNWSSWMVWVFVCLCMLAVIKKIR